MVFLVKAPPHPLKAELAPLPPAYYDPKPPLPHFERPKPPWDPNLDHDPIDIQEEETQFQRRPDSDIVKQQRQNEGFSDYYDDNLEFQDLPDKMGRRRLLSDMPESGPHSEQPRI